MALVYLPFGSQLKSALASEHLTDAKFIQGTYVVVADIAERDALKIHVDDGDNDGTIIKGSLVYVQSENLVYMYNGTAYEEWANGATALAIIDVEELPTEDITDNVFYRLTKDDVVTIHHHKDDTWYQIDDDLIVIANPEDEATDVLGKITIGDTTYSLDADAIVEVETLPTEEIKENKIYKLAATDDTEATLNVYINDDWHEVTTLTEAEIIELIVKNAKDGELELLVDEVISATETDTELVWGDVYTEDIVVYISSEHAEVGAIELGHDDPDAPDPMDAWVTDAVYDLSETPVKITVPVGSWVYYIGTDATKDAPIDIIVRSGVAKTIEEVLTDFANRIEALEENTSEEAIIDLIYAHAKNGTMTLYNDTNLLAKDVYVYTRFADVDGQHGTGTTPETCFFKNTTDEAQTYLYRMSSDPALTGKLDKLGVGTFSIYNEDGEKVGNERIHYEGKITLPSKHLIQVSSLATRQTESTVSIRLYMPEDGKETTLEEAINLKSQVEANPETEAAENLSKINIEGITYGITGDVNYTNDKPTAIDVGGVKVGTTFDNMSIQDILTKMFYPYQDWSLTSLTTSDEAKTYEYGTTKTISKVKINIKTGEKDITYISISDGTNTILELEGADAAANINKLVDLDESIDWDGTSDLTFTATVKGPKEDDTERTSTATAKFSTTKYIYYATSASDTEIPTTGTQGNDTTINVGSNEYIYFLSPTAKTKIQQWAAGSWNDVKTKDMGKVNFTLDSGVTVEYFAYRGPEMTANNEKYKLV